MRQDCDAPAVSIHAYSPPLWRMGAYVVEPDGTLRRESISYAEELRPFDAGGVDGPHPEVGGPRCRLQDPLI